MIFSKFRKKENFVELVPVIFPENKENTLCDKEVINNFFGLAYTNYYVIQRSILQAMPKEWQENFVNIIKEMESFIDFKDIPREFRVQACKNGKFIKDNFAIYRNSEKIPFHKK